MLRWCIDKDTSSAQRPHHHHHTHTHLPSLPSPPHSLTHRQASWSVWTSWTAGSARDAALRAVFPVIVVMEGMDQKDYCSDALVRQCRKLWIYHSFMVSTSLRRTFFLRAGGTWLLRSILSCSPGCGHARRRLLQWHVLCWFCWLLCTSWLCCLRLVAGP